MNDKERKKGGRPPRYDGEESIRIGALIRPRYKEILDIVAQRRQGTLSETVELAIAILADSIKSQITGLSLLDTILDVNCDTPRLWFVLALKDTPPNPESAEYNEKISTFLYNQVKFTKLPTELKRPHMIYFHDIAKNIGFELIIYFERKKLSQAISECWKIGYTVEKVCTIIKEIIEQVVNNCLPEDNIEIMNELNE